MAKEFESGLPPGSRNLLRELNARRAAKENGYPVGYDPTKHTLVGSGTDVVMVPDHLVYLLGEE